MEKKLLSNYHFELGLKVNVQYGIMAKREAIAHLVENGSHSKDEARKLVKAW